MSIRSAGVAAALLLSSAAMAQEIDLHVELMGPLGTKTSHKGDKVFARVAEPAALKGDMVEGAVTEARSGGKLRGNSVLNFSFDTLRHGSDAIAISTQVKSFRNSQGQADVDEEGRIIRKGGGNTGKALGGTAAGGLIGGLAGGLKGAAIGAGAGAAASIAVIEIAADAPDIRFNPGSIIVVSAKSRSGSGLDTLAGPAAAAPAPASATAAPAAPAPVAAAAGNAPAVAPAGGTVQPNMVALKAEFIPGEKTLFFDDFTDMSPDEAPPHWKARGASMTLKEGGGVRQATFTERATLMPLITGIPKNFTLEQEVKYENPDDLRVVWHLRAKGSDRDELYVWVQTHSESIRVRVLTPNEELADTSIPMKYDQPIKQALWIQNGRVRFYANGQRMMDANHVELPPIETLVMDTEVDAQSGTISLRSTRIAESTPDFSHSISSTGRYVTYGILFDTDSDRLKAESAGVIKSIAAGLQANPSLKLRIEGHTDTTGGDAHNMELSQRRAEAVKAVLVSQFQVDGSRLSAAGIGSTKPVASNDTPQGRAQNRRVELVKQ